MVPANNPDLHPLIRKLESIFDLTAEERHAIVKLPITLRDLKADQDIVRDQDRPSRCCLVLEAIEPHRDASPDQLPGHIGALRP
jgi:hypothetical protein